MPQRKPTQRAPTSVPCQRPGCTNRYIMTKRWRKFCSDRCRVQHWFNTHLGQDQVRALQNRVSQLERQLAKSKSK